MVVLYWIGIKLYVLLIYLSSPFSNKAKKWIKGRKNIFNNIQSKYCKNENVIWFHCASLGEFEQGRPLIEKFKKETDYKIFLTFFSPSGYEIRKNYDGADYVFYLPIDSKKNAKQFISIIKPRFVVFVKYEFWYYYIDELYKNNIPMYTISSIFRYNQLFFKWYGGWYRDLLHKINILFVQNDDSKKLLSEYGINNVVVCGDTRFDRVKSIVKNRISIKKIEEFKDDKQIIILGSSWKKDEIIFSELQNYILSKEYKIIVVPHEIDKNHIEFISKNFNNSIEYSKIKNKEISKYDVLVVDTIGILSSLYAYSEIAYIGGGFNSGIHNILEAVIYEIPVIFGRKYKKFNEAVELVDKGGAFSIANKDELMRLLEKMIISENRKDIKKISRAYIEKNIGATDLIYRKINKLIN